jgi:hypothetical protein
VADQQRGTGIDRRHGHRPGDRAAHAPRQHQVGAQLAHQLAQLAAVPGQVAAGAQALAHAAAQLQRPRAQRRHLHALGAGLLRQRPVRAREHHRAGQAAYEVEQRALGAAEQAGVGDRQRPHAVSGALRGP